MNDFGDERKNRKCPECREMLSAKFLRRQKLNARIETLFYYLCAIVFCCVAAYALYGSITVIDEIKRLVPKGMAYELQENTGIVYEIREK